MKRAAAKENETEHAADASGNADSFEEGSQTTAATSSGIVSDDEREQKAGRQFHSRGSDDQCAAGWPVASELHLHAHEQDREHQQIVVSAPDPVHQDHGVQSHDHNRSDRVEIA